MEDGKPQPSGDPPKQHPVLEQVLQALNIVPAFWQWLRQEVREVKRAPIAFIATLAIGLYGGWWLVGHFKDGELADQRKATEQSDIANKSLKGVIEGYREQRDSLELRLKGLIPEDVARQIASNMPADRRIDGFLVAISNLVSKVESLDPALKPLSTLTAEAVFTVVGTTNFASMRQAARQVSQSPRGEVPWGLKFWLGSTGEVSFGNPDIALGTTYIQVDGPFPPNGKTEITMSFNRPLAGHFFEDQLAKGVSGQSKPARDGRMKTSHFEDGIAHRAAVAAQVRGEPTQREPAANHLDPVVPWLVAAPDRAATGHRPRNRRPVCAPG